MRLPPIPTRTYTLVPSTTLCRSDLSVGAKLAHDSVGSGNSVVDDPPPSRAGSLPHCNFSGQKQLCLAQIRLWEQSLLAIAECQSVPMLLTDRKSTRLNSSH